MTAWSLNGTTDERRACRWISVRRHRRAPRSVARPMTQRKLVVINTLLTLLNVAFVVYWVRHNSPMIYLNATMLLVCAWNYYMAYDIYRMRRRR
jgi:hypothetical protein